MGVSGLLMKLDDDFKEVMRLMGDLLRCLSSIDEKLARRASLLLVDSGEGSVLNSGKVSPLRSGSSKSINKL